MNKTFRHILCVSLLIGVLGLYSCTHSSPLPPLEFALNQAGDNRIELEKVLMRYQLDPKDSLKYKAACFLIENMPYYTYYEGKLLDDYLSYYTALLANRTTGVTPEAISDSIKAKYGPYTIEKLQFKRDIVEIDSAYLCNNVDWAFKVWLEQPWGKNISFADFCEYVLPYRIEDEKLVSWRERMYKKYNPLLDSLRASLGPDKEDPIQAVFCLTRAISREEDIRFTSKMPANLPHVGPEVAELKSGSCREFSDYVVYVCRALGIPVAIDFMPIRGNENVGHFWVSFFDKYGELYLQDFPQKVMKVRVDWMRHMPKVKVYRHTFSLNREMKQAMCELDSVIYPFFSEPHFIDVTFPYAWNYKAKLHVPESKIYSGKPDSKIAYLCISQRLRWTPVAWTAFDRDNLVFTDIHKGSMMRVATFEEGKLVYWTDPFQIDDSNEYHFFSGMDSVQDVTLYAKFNLQEEKELQERMIGGVFEGSNDADFLEKDTLYIIEEAPARLNTVVAISVKKKYRYVRYYGAPDAHCNIAEAILYDVDGQALKGKVIGTPGCYQGDGSHEYSNVFDGKTWTSYDYKEASGGWSGLDLGTPQEIFRILYTPRNRDNYIRPGDQFELFYCQKVWKSLGKTTSQSDSLLYKGVPRDALLLLVNYSRGVQERIFTYEGGEQLWK